ncbi:zinc dependent phospholipase C family protein [Sulfuriferula thiophila]|uniref:zinc dependent phospholipase C family protein n=1 Tax=Sulfuriferula thiophila TaxID=1781211 RepID=UPI000F609635|nr:zinc dependent phospholipase C family protein [Sulfuriferula thiophila]
MKKLLRYVLWCVPLLLQANDANAWGLYTHVYFAQWLLWGVPLLDSELRRAVSRYPKLVMAGACLPDLAIIGRVVGTQAFEQTHNWQDASRMLQSAQNDAERAIAVGYYSHLFADVVAHHHFVPAHERLWLDWPMLAHTVSEWAMDAHISEHLLATPNQLLRAGELDIVPFVSRHFALPEQQTRRAVRVLARADQGLRWCRLPQGLYRNVMRLDKRVVRRFNYFISETSSRFAELNRVLAGDSPILDANGGCAKMAQQRLAQFSDHQIKRGQPLPDDCFYGSP